MVKITYLDNQNQPVARARKNLLFVAGFVLLAFFIGAVGGVWALVYVAGNENAQKTLGIEKFVQKLDFQPTKTEKIVLEESSVVIDSVDKVAPAVVSISTTRDVRDFFGQVFQQQGGGTGFIITEDGMIVTNKHVVDDASATYTVFTADGKDYEAKILAKDPSMDLAIMKIEATGLPVVDLGDSDAMKVGQSVIAIGNALGEFKNSVTVGVISAKERQIEASGTGITEKLEGLLQTDAAINPGNSGGPLVNIKGQVIGVNTAVAQAENIGFAIPVNSVKNTIDQMKKFGKIKRPYLGVRYIPITKEIAKLNNLKIEYGALVVQGENRAEVAVLPSSPADKAGIKENDIILEIAGQRIDENNSLAKIIAKQQVGDEVDLKIIHSGKEQTVKAILEEVAE